MPLASVSAHQKRPYLWFQIVVNIAAWIPLLVLVFDFVNNRLTVNPIQAATQRTGNIALVLLIISLACTPLYTIFGFKPALKVRRELGLYAYLYAAIHFLIFVGADYGFDLRIIFQTIAEKQFVLIGLGAFLLLTLLALTSFHWWMIRLGKQWKRLHRIVYGINVLVVLHFGLAVKGDIFRLQGEIGRPILAGIVIILLLIARLPVIRKWKQELQHNLHR